MANALYSSLVSLVSTYVGPEKGPGIVERQMKNCTATPDTLTKEDLKKIQAFVVGAMRLYLSADPAKFEEARAKVTAMAG